MRKGCLSYPYDRAIADHSRVALNPDDADAYFNRGDAYRCKGEYALSIEDFTKATERKLEHRVRRYTIAIELKHDFAEAYGNRGVAYLNKDDSDHAIEDFTKAIELNLSDVNPYNYRGRLYFNKGEYSLAIKDCTKAIELNPGDVAYYKQIEADPTIEYDDPVIDLKWAYGRSHLYRGMARLHLGEWGGAKSNLIIAKKLGENIVAMFRYNYESISDFNQKHGVQLPDDLAELLIPPQA